jgi:hypothetical protein
MGAVCSGSQEAELNKAVNALFRYSEVVTKDEVRASTARSAACSRHDFRLDAAPRLKICKIISIYYVLLSQKNFG